MKMRHDEISFDDISINDISKGHKTIDRLKICPDLMKPLDNTCLNTDS